MCNINAPQPMATRNALVIGHVLFITLVIRETTHDGEIRGCVRKRDILPIFLLAGTIFTALHPKSKDSMTSTMGNHRYFFVAWDMLNFYKFSYVFKKNDYTLLDLVSFFKSLVFLLFFPLICPFWDLYSFPVAVITNHHKLSGLRQQTVILSQFWRPIVRNQSVRRSTLLPETPGETPLPAPAGCPFPWLKTTSLQSLSVFLSPSAPCVSPLLLCHKDTCDRE